MRVLTCLATLLLCGLVANAGAPPPPPPPPPSSDLYNSTIIAICQSTTSDATFYTVPAYVNAALLIDQDMIAENCGKDGWGWCRYDITDVSTDSNGYFTLTTLDEPMMSTLDLLVTVDVSGLPQFEKVWADSSSTCGQFKRSIVSNEKVVKTDARQSVYPTSAAVVKHREARARRDAARSDADLERRVKRSNVHA